MSHVSLPLAASEMDRPKSADWYADPTGRHRLRYFDGEDWTDAVTHFGPVPCRACGPEQ